MATPTKGKIETLTFQVSEIRFSKDGFHIVRTTRGDSVAGKFNARVGHCYKSEGVWDTDSEKARQFGPTFKLESAVSVRMTTPEALGRFLVLSLKGKGVGEAFIGSLVEAVKSDNLDLEELLDKSNRDVLVECVGSRNAKKVDTLLDIWPKIKPQADLMSPLLGYGLSEAMAETVLALYGKEAIRMVEDRPYDLILRVDGVSFLRADSIAMKVGRIEKTDPVRLRAAMSMGMRDATTNGDVGVRRKTLIDKTMPLVNEAILENGRRKMAPGVPPVVSLELLTKTLDEMIAGVHTEADGTECAFSSDLFEAPDEKGETVVWYRPLWEAEELIASRLAAFNAAPRPDLLSLIDGVVASLGIKALAPEQRAAVEMAVMNPVSVITGGPGCGKTFVLKVVLGVFKLAGLKGNLTAPTGKAAKRITESTGYGATTQHSLIGFQGGRAAFDQTCPLPAQYLVVDESSMDDTELLAATLNAAANGCRIIIQGDVDQLSSVGPGQCLRDLIRSGVIAVTKLTKGFRFSGGIDEAARAVNRGEIPESSDDGQFEVVESETPTQDLMAAVKQLLSEGVNPDDIQVLAPVHKGDAGTMALNKAMQALLNPEAMGGTSVKLKRDSGDIRVNDRVIQKKNDKEYRLVNGDMGWVDGLNSDLQVTLSLPDRADPVVMPRDKAQNLHLAYCITVHSSQGAEAPYVLIALDRASAFMLRRNLVYTGITRASKKCKVFTSRTTLASAVRRGEPPEGSRRTALVSKLHAAFAGRKPAPVLTVPALKAEDPLAKAMLVGQIEDVPF